MFVPSFFHVLVKSHWKSQNKSINSVKKKHKIFPPALHPFCQRLPALFQAPHALRQVGRGAWPGTACLVHLQPCYQGCGGEGPWPSLGIWVRVGGWVWGMNLLRTWGWRKKNMENNYGMCGNNDFIRTKFGGCPTETDLIFGIWPTSIGAWYQWISWDLSHHFWKEISQGI